MSDAHSVIVVDGDESMRAHSDYPQTASSDYDADDRWVEADVTPIYRENFPDLVAGAPQDATAP